MVGVDAAAAMVSLARRLHPELDFRQADAHKLAFDDASFDAVVGNFLRRLALTTWDLPDRAGFLGVFLDAVAEAGATLPADLPVGPDFFRCSVDEEFDALFGEQGMEDRAVRTVAFAHRVATADELWDASSAVRSEPPPSS